MSVAQEVIDNLICKGVDVPYDVAEMIVTRFGGELLTPYDKLGGLTSEEAERLADFNSTRAEEADSDEIFRVFVPWYRDRARYFAEWAANEQETESEFASGRRIRSS